MKEYLEFNNTNDKRLIMTCISEKACTMRYSSTDIRRECMGLPIIHRFKKFKNNKMPLSKTLKIYPFSKISKLGSLNLSNYSKYFKMVRDYNRRYNND